LPNIAEAGKPGHKGILAESSELALVVVARGLGECFRRSGEGDRAFEVRIRFAVSDEADGLGIEWDAVADKARNLFKPAAK